MAASDEIVIFELKVDKNNAQQAIIDYTIEINKLKKEIKEVEKAEKEGKLTEQEATKQKIQATNEIKKLTEAQKLNEKVVNNNINSYNSLELQLKEAEKELKNLENAFIQNADGSIEVSDAYQEQFAQVKKLRGALEDFKKEQGKKTFKELIDEIKEGRSETKIFGVSLGDAKDALNKFTEGGIKGTIKNLIELGKAFLLTPFGIIAGLVALVTAAFARSQKGAEFLRVAMAGLGQVMDFLLKPLEFVVDGVIALADGAGKAYDAIKDFFGFKDDTVVKNAAELEKQLIAIEKKAVSQATRDKESLALQERLKTLRDSELKGVEANIKANEDLGKELRRNFEEQITFENELLKNLQDRLAIEKNTKDQEELKKQINEQQQKIAERKADFEGKITEQITNQTSKLKEQRDLQREIAQTQLDLDILQGKIVKGSERELNKRIDLIKQQRDADLLLKEGALERQDIELKAELEIEGLRKEFNDAQKERNKEAIERAKEVAQARKDLASQLAKDEIEINLAGLQKQLDDFDAQTAQLDQKNTLALLRRQQERLEIENQFIEQQKALRKLQEQDELAAAKEQALALRKIGVSKLETDKLLAAEEKRIKLQTITDINQLTIDAQLKAFEAEKQILETSLQQQRDARLKALDLQANDAQNALMEAQMRNQLDFEQRLQINALNYEKEREQLLQQRQAEEITYQEYLSRLQTASLNYENNRQAIERQKAQERLDAEANLNQTRIGLLKDFSEVAIAIAGQNEEIAKSAAIFQKTLALFEVALNLQRTLSNVQLAGAKQDAILPGSGIAYRVFATASAVAQAVKIIADIKKIAFAEGGYTGKGFGSPDSSGFKPAGIVHEGEYVMPKWLVESPRGNSLMRQAETMRLGRYAAGGTVTAFTGSSNVSSVDTTGIIVNALQNMNLFVSVAEFNTVNARVKAVEQRAGL